MQRLSPRDKRYGIEDRNGESCQLSHAGLHYLSQAARIHDGGLGGNTCSHANSSANSSANCYLTPTPTPPGFELLFAVAGIGVAIVIYTNKKRRRR